MQAATISKSIIQFWSKFHIQILWYSFTRGSRFLLTPSQSLPGKHGKLPPATVDTSTTALLCIFSSLLNSVMEGWKCRSRELWKAIFMSRKNRQTDRFDLRKVFFNFYHKCAEVPISPISKSTSPILCCFIFFKKCLNPQVLIKKMLNKHCRSFRIYFYNTPSYNSMDS